MRTETDKKLLFNKAIALREEGKYTEAADLMLDLAKDTDNLFEKAGMLLNLTHTLKASGRLDLARNELNAARTLLELPRETVLPGADDENRRRLLIWSELEEARISAAESKVQEALTKLNTVLAEHECELQNPALGDLYWSIQRDRGFHLAELASYGDASHILEEVDSADPHDRWTLFYLGYCHHCMEKYVEAKEKLEEAISLGLPPNFEGQAHCLLGVGCFKLGDYTKAKLELEKGVETAPLGYVKEARIWKWLESACMSLGLRGKAEHYRRLAQSS